jgi:hypothetical protein
MMKNRLGALLRAAAICATAAACGGGDKGGGGVIEPPLPVPGVLTVSLTTPNANDRAAVLVVVAPEPVTGVESAATGVVMHQRTTGTVTRVAVFGRLPSGALLRLNVADVNKSAQYTVTLQEVADATNALRPALTGYTATVTR